MRNVRSMLVTGAAVAATAIGGGAIANAASSSSSTSTNTTATTQQAPPAFNGPAPGTQAHENAEKAVTGTDAARAQAAAVKAAGGGTAGAVTTMYTGTGYEVTVTKTNGSQVVIHLDSSFTVMQGPGGPGQPPTAP